MNEKFRISYTLMNDRKFHRTGGCHLAGYRRFIAYVYEYQKGRKANNCGFMKVEVKNGICTAEIHLQIKGMAAEEQCKVYGFWRKEGLLNGILMGSCKTIKDGIECLIETNALSVGESGIPLEKMGGMILLTESGAFLGTEWDDQAIRPENFKEMKTVPAAEKKQFEETEGEEIECERERSEETEGEKGEIKEIEREEENAKESERERTDAKETESERREAKEIERERADVKETENERGESEETEREVVESEETDRERMETDWKVDEALEKEESENKESINKQADINLKDENIHIQSVASQNTKTKNTEKITLPFGQEFCPFDDCDMQCWKIHPQDLVYFPRRQCSLRNNRFLQYGYYHFGHLLLCRRGNGRYILGVPGCYDQQEQFMAGMFGFSCFKESPQIKVSKGRGGYWYRAIDPPLCTGTGM